MLEAGKRKGRIIMAYDLRFVHLGITIQHLQNHITIFPAHLDIAQTIVRNAPDKRNKFVVN